MPVKSQVRQALDEFYHALERVFQGDVDPMAAVWSHDAEVTLMGSDGDRVRGWKEVRSHFEHLSRAGIGGRIVPQDILVRVEGDVAYTVCLETADGMTVEGRPISFSQRVTHVLRFEDQSWRILHRHTDPTPALGVGVSAD